MFTVWSWGSCARQTRDRRWRQTVLQTKQRHRCIPGGGSSVLGMQDLWHKLQDCVQTYLQNLGHVDGSLCMPASRPRLASWCFIRKTTTKRSHGVLALWFKIKMCLVITQINETLQSKIVIFLFNFPPKQPPIGCECKAGAWTVNALH